MVGGGQHRVGWRGTGSLSWSGLQLQQPIICLSACPPACPPAASVPCLPAHLPASVTRLPACSPRTLRDVLDSKELDEERRRSILRQALAGLAHIHSQGIIHRDLKVGGFEPSICPPPAHRLLLLSLPPPPQLFAERFPFVPAFYSCLQPANTFLDSQGTVKLGDFGELVTDGTSLMTCGNCMTAY